MLSKGRLGRSYHPTLPSLDEVPISNRVLMGEDYLNMKQYEVPKNRNEDLILDQQRQADEMGRLNALRQSRN